MPGPALESGRHTLLERILKGVTRGVVRFPATTLVGCLALACAGGWVTHTTLRFKTSRADLIDPATAYHQRWLNYTREFGDVSEDMVVVVEGSDRETIKRAMDDLGPRIERESALFQNVLYRVDLGRLRAKALQYSSPEQLDQVLLQLDEFSPLLRNFDLLTLRSLVREMRLKLEESQRQPDEIAGQIVEPFVRQTGLLLASLGQFARDRRDYMSPWQALAPGGSSELSGEFRDRYLLNDKGTMGFIKAQPVAASSDFNGTSPAISRLREMIAEAGARHPRVRLGLTGVPVLESDEMRDSQTAMFKASILSFIGVAALMLLGFRGLRYPLVGSAVLLVGMAWSFGFTTLAIGHLNILSVSFAAMLIGIGIDYSTVYLLRYLEVRHMGRTAAEALVETATSAGAGIWTAAVSSSVAFVCAIFTDFAGVSELGIIAGGGILLCTVGAFVVIPAILMLIDRGRPADSLPRPSESRWLSLLTARYPLWVTLACSVAIAWISTYGFRLEYDYNLLHLQARGLESVDVQKRIFDQAEHSLLFAVSLADSPREVLELKQRFESLPGVHHVEELAAMLPRNPAEETFLQVQAVHAQLSQLPARATPPRDVSPRLLGDELEKLETLLTSLATPQAAALGRQLGGFLDEFEQLTRDEQVRVLRDYQSRMAADLLARLRGLEAVSQTEPLSPADLAPNLVGRFISPHGKWLLQIYPRNQIWDIEPLEKFIQEVRSVDPEATGTPLQTYEASRAIKRSYELVGLYALVAVTMFLLIDFRNPLHCVLALLPPLAGAALMFGLLGIFEIPLNPANLIVLPLVIGLGVDGGVHVIHDYRQRAGAYSPSASVINAIIVNSTTTMVGFGSMLIANHRGLFSLGLVLTIGVGTCLLVAVVLLPAILTLLSRGRASVVSTVVDDGSPIMPETVSIEPWPAEFVSRERAAFASRGADEKAAA
ncbi:MAG: MMPL family transporter [Planctomycetaceae bacterium]